MILSFNLTYTIRVTKSPQIGVGSGLDSQGSVTLRHKYCFPNFHVKALDVEIGGPGLRTTQKSFFKKHLMDVHFLPCTKCQIFSETAVIANNVWSFEACLCPSNFLIF